MRLPQEDSNSPDETPPQNSDSPSHIQQILRSLRKKRCGPWLTGIILSGRMLTDRPKVCFVSLMCLLDRRSGAAKTVSGTLEMLARQGFESYSSTASLCDGDTEYPMKEAFGPKIDLEKARGNRIRISQNKVHHNVYLTESSLGQKLTREEARGYVKMAIQDLERIRPDIVITYGGSEISRILREKAKQLGAHIIFYLANESYMDIKDFSLVDTVLCPSEYTANLYRERLGLDPAVFRSIIPANVIPKNPISRLGPEAREHGLITMVNPSGAKGGTLFFRLVEMAAQQRPDLTFLALESRSSKETWTKAGLEIGILPNLWWLVNQRQMHRVYARTTILLVPSFWQESSARVAAEAQLAGIPVLASRRGGIPDQLNGAGFLFDLPERCTKNFGAIPTREEVQPWLDTILRLVDDDAFYRESSDKALEAAQPFHPEQRAKDVAQRFRSFLEMPLLQ